MRAPLHVRLGLRPGRRPDGPDGGSGDPGEPADGPGATAEPAEPAQPARPEGAGGGVRRRAGLLARRRLRLAVLALAVLLPGGATVGTAMGMVSVSDDGGAAPSPALEGGLPVQDDTVEDELDPFLEPELLEAVPVGAEPVAEPVADVLSGSRVIDELGESGIPSVALRAYMQAADRLATDNPGCGIRWTLLAAIGRVESNHGRFGGARLQEDGYGTKPIRGIPLDGRPNVAVIRDTDGGELDGDTTYDRAVGPMQFIPSTWASVGVDANGDGRSDPNNIVDAAQGAAVYLCDGGGDLRDTAQRGRAIRRYNNAASYVRVVQSLAQQYESGRVETEPPVPGSGPPRMPEPRPTPAPRPAPDGGGGGNGSSGGDGGGSGGSGGGSGSGGGAVPAPAPRPRPAPTTTPPTTAPRPRPPTTTTTPPTTAPPTTAPSTTAPPTTAPPTTAPDPDPGTPPTTAPESEPVPPEDPPAAVGWAPAMRQVVVGILEDESAESTPTTSTTAPAPPPGSEAPVPPPGCPGTDPAVPPTGGPGEPPADAPAECPPASPPPPPGEAPGG